MFVDGKASRWLVKHTTGSGQLVNEIYALTNLLAKIGLHAAERKYFKIIQSFFGLRAYTSLKGQEGRSR